MKNQGRIGRYLAQGLGANAIASYLILISLLLWSGDGQGAGFTILFALPIYWFVAGLFGLATAAGLWVFEYAIDSKFNFWFRALFGILLPLALAAAIGWLGGFLFEPAGLLGVAMFFAILIFPAALLSGSRVNPLKFIIVDLQLPESGARALSIIGVPLLRLSSVVALLEALIWLACLRSVALGGWRVLDNEFLGAVIAVVYFAITLIVSLCLPDKIIIMACAVVANAPVIAFEFAAQERTSLDSLFFAVVSWLFVSLWILFLIGQFMRSANRRFLPVTMLEIRIRHAFNYW